MGYYAISNCIFYKSAMREILALVSLKSNISKPHNVISSHIIVVRL